MASNSRIDESRVITVLILDPFPVVLIGLEAMVQNSVDLEMAGYASTMGEAVSLARSVHIDAFLISSDTDLSDWRDFIQASSRPEIVLALLRAATQEEISKAAALEVDGYLALKDLTLGTLVRSLERVVAGLPCLLLGAIERPPPLDFQEEWRRKFGRSFLTVREQDVLNLVAEGMTNKQIGSQLNISEHGAKRHVANLLAKLNCTNRTHVATRAIHEKLVR